MTRAVTVILMITVISVLSEVLVEPSLASDESHTMPAFEKRYANLNIVCKYTEGRGSMPIDGVAFEIYRISDVANDDGSISYHLLDRYEDPNIILSGMTALESNAYAKKLESKTEGDKNVRKAVTDSNGSARFAELEFGIYLVKQTGKTGSASEFATYDPFLVIIPGISENNTWIYDVEIDPKPTTTKIPETTTVTERPPNHDEPTAPGNPRTGDEVYFDLWVLLMAVSLLGALCICLDRSIKVGTLKNRDNDKRELRS